jgi:hypothetical protein
MANDPYLEIINTRDNYIRQLALDSANPLPDYSVGGQSVSRVAWRDSLYRQINELNRLASIMQPVEFRTQVY